MALFIEIKAADGLVSRTILEPGKNRFTVRLGDSYRIFDDQTGLTPQGIAVKRVDNDLLVDGLGVADTTVEFAAFYSVCSAGSPCELTVDSSSGGAPMAITPGTQPIGALADGSFVLYDPRFAETAPPAPATGDGTMARNVLYGVGGLAVVGLAAGGGGGGGGGGDDGGGAAPVGTLKFTSSPLVNSRTPTLTGEAEPGARVLVRIDTDGDGAPNVTYATTVGADSRWSVNLATAAPESGALPAGGVPDSSIVGITSTTGVGVASLPPFTLAFDGVPPAPAVIDAVATDNVVNAAERQNGFVISGAAEGGSTVLLSLGTQVLATVAVQENGQWQTQTLSSATVPADGAYVLSAVVQDRASNLSPAAESSLSINTAPPLLIGLSVAGGDNTVAINDAASVAFSGRTDPNAVVQVQWNGSDKPVTADAGGNWSLAYAGAEVPNSDGAVFPYSIAATNAIGNTVVQTGQILVDRLAPGPAVVNPVATDNVVNAAEKQNGFVISGAAEGGSTVVLSLGARVLASLEVPANGSWQTGPFSGASVPADGNYVLSAVVQDDAGNVSTATQSALTISTAPPRLTGLSIAGGDSTVAVADSASVGFFGQTDPGAVVQVRWNDISKPVTANGSGDWSIAYAGAEVPDSAGANFGYSITATNAVGNTAVQSGAIYVDRIAPAAPVIAPVEGDNIVTPAERVDGVPVSGQGEPGTRINVTWGTVTLPATVDGAGQWAVQFASEGLPAVPSPGGATTIGAVATDSAGNSASTQATVTIQSIFPAPIISVVEGDDAVTLLEALDGVVLSGTVQLGVAGVDVAWGPFFAGAATLDGTGTNWAISVPVELVPPIGSWNVQATATGAGGGAVATRLVTIGEIDLQGAAAGADDSRAVTSEELTMSSPSYLDTGPAASSAGSVATVNALLAEDSRP